MEKKSLIFGFAFILVLTGLVFVFAALDAPSDLIFEQNATVNYDDDGTVFLNWSEVTNADNYTIFIYADDVMFTSVKNSSTSSYLFTNTTNANYTFTVQAENSTGSGQYTNSTNLSIVVDTISPDIVIETPTNNTGANRTWIFVNVTITEANNDTVTFYLYNSTGLVYSNSSNYNLSEAITINWTGLSNDEAYYFIVLANDSANNSDESNEITFYLDGTNPVATLSCSPSSVSRGSIVTCTCTGTDSGSGINDSLTSAATTPSTSSAGTFTATGCSVTDYAGNSDTDTDTYTVTSSSSGGTAPTYEWAFQKTHAWSKITPGTAAIMKDFGEEIGLKQIQIQVNNEAQNVKMTISKYNSKPAEVSVEKSGKTYKYLQINAENLEGKLDKAIIRMQVEKSWMITNSFEVNNMAMFKFNEDNNGWEELVMTYVEADDDYYYYDAEVDSFSYFAISEKVLLSEEDTETPGEEGVSEEKGLKWWGMVLIILAALAVLYMIYINKKKIIKLFKKR